MSTAPTALPQVPPQRVILRHSEVMADAMASRSRAGGGGTWFTLSLLVLLGLAIELGHVSAFWLVQQLPFSAMFVLGPWLPIVVPSVLALVAVKVALDIEQRRAHRAYLRTLGAAGAPLEREGVYEVTPEALVLTTDRIVLAPRWHAIDTIERGAHGWVISADQLHFLVPFAAFTDVAAQKTLLHALTARLSAEARARSRDAVEFAEQASATVRQDATSEPPASHELAVPATELAEATGWLTQEQSAWAANVVYSRVARLGFHRWAYPLTGGITGFTAGLVVLRLGAWAAPPELFFHHPFGAFLAGALVLLAYSAFGLGYAWSRLGIVAEKAWRAGLAARGVPEQIEARWSLTATGLAYRTARFSGEAAFASVHQVLHEHGYWIVACDTMTLCIPDGAFGGADRAGAFMSALGARISEDARARSVALP